MYVSTPRRPRSIYVPTLDLSADSDATYLSSIQAYLLSTKTMYDPSETESIITMVLNATMLMILSLTAPTSLCPQQKISEASDILSPRRSIGLDDDIS